MSAKQRDAAIERWLRDEVVAGHAESMADPSKGVPAKDILAHIKASREANGASPTSYPHRNAH